MRPKRSTAASTSACAAVDGGDVAACRRRGAAGGDDLVDHRGRRSGVGAVALHRAAEVVDDDAARPASASRQRVRPADAAARAGDDRDPPVEAVLVHTAPRSAVVVPTSHSYYLELCARRPLLVVRPRRRHHARTAPRPATRSTARWRSGSKPRSTASRTIPTSGSVCSAPTPPTRSGPVFCAGADLKVIRETGSAGVARHRAGRVRRVRVPRAHEADRRRRRRPRDRGRSRDRARVPTSSWPPPGPRSGSPRCGAT